MGLDCAKKGMTWNDTIFNQKHFELEWNWNKGNNKFKEEPNKFSFKKYQILIHILIILSEILIKLLDVFYRNM